MLTLGITTSSGQFAVVISKNKDIIYTNNTPSNQPKKELFEILTEGLRELNKKTQDISEIIVDIGPGGTSSVRTGVSFANALSYGMNVPVYPVSSFELIGTELWQKYKLPSIITAKSIKNNAFIAYFNNNKLQKLVYGKISEEFDNLIDGKEIYVAGAHQDMIIQDFGSKYKINKSGILRANPEILIKNKEQFSRRKLIYPDIAIPITEQNIRI